MKHLPNIGSCLYINISAVDLQSKKAVYTHIKHNRYFHECPIEEYSAIRGSSPQIMKIELVSISATESSFLHSVKVA